MHFEIHCEGRLELQFRRLPFAIVASKLYRVPNQNSHTLNFCGKSKKFANRSTDIEATRCDGKVNRDVANFQLDCSNSKRYSTKIQSLRIQFAHPVLLSRPPAVPRRRLRPLLRSRCKCSKRHHTAIRDVANFFPAATRRLDVGAPIRELFRYCYRAGNHALSCMGRWGDFSLHGCLSDSRVTEQLLSS